jgi:hypothetical protein
VAVGGVFCTQGRSDGRFSGSSEAAEARQIRNEAVLVKLGRVQSWATVNK